MAPLGPLRAPALRNDLPRLPGHPVRGAFIVSPESLRAFDSLLLDFFEPQSSGPRRTITVRIQGEADRQFTSVDDVCELRNPQGAPIKAITIDFWAEDVHAQVQIDAGSSKDCAAMRLFAHHQNSDKLSSLDATFRKETRNTRDRWNSWHRRIVDSFVAALIQYGRRILVAMWLVFVLVFLLGLLSTALSRCSSTAAPIRHQRTVREPERKPSDPPPAPSAAELKRRADQQAKLKATAEAEARREFMRGVISLGVLAVMGVGGFLVVMAYSWLFPRVSFTIGEGKQRQEKVTKLRFWFVTTVVVGWIVLPLVEARLKAALTDRDTFEQAP